MRAQICPLCHSYLIMTNFKSLNEENLCEMTFKCFECNMIEYSAKFVYLEQYNDYFEVK